MKNPNNFFPINVTGQIQDNRIDCGRLNTKNTWEIIVTRTISIDLYSKEIAQMSSYLSLTSAGNLGPPYFL